MMVLKFRIIKIRTSIMFVCVCVCFEWTAYVGQILGLKRWTKPRFVSYRSIFHIEYWTSKYTEHCSILHIVVLPEHNLISIPFIADLFLHNLEFFIQFGFSSDWNWIRSTDVTCIRRNGNVNKSEMERQKYIFFRSSLSLSSSCCCCCSVEVHTKSSSLFSEAFFLYLLSIFLIFDSFTVPCVCFRVLEKCWKPEKWDTCDSHMWFNLGSEPKSQSDARTRESTHTHWLMLSADGKSSRALREFLTYSLETLKTDKTGKMLCACVVWISFKDEWKKWLSINIDIPLIMTKEGVPVGKKRKKIYIKIWQTKRMAKKEKKKPFFCHSFGGFERVSSL